eukprot:TRINITY_DN26869_c0_g1_i1.p1 TRINITY_DN26869_c0_g1~~TRINITY_DN26869_c0_g1_i1.p1  ORF type:complete len:212 (-),score=47.07 TRINITY_DN26869_c0_g1_i1:42-677(-)
MPKHNNMIPDAHFHKDWQNRVKTWFDQPGRKVRRRRVRAARAARIAPRPLDLLRPQVTCPTLRYNIKNRLGRGFTLDELRAAKINVHQALTIGIAVDHRRTNRSEEKFNDNVERLKKYSSSLILFPRKEGKPKQGDTKDVSKAQQHTGVVQPIKTGKLQFVTAKVEQYKTPAFTRLRRARADARLIGRRANRVKREAEKAAAANKKAEKGK